MPGRTSKSSFILSRRVAGSISSEAHSLSRFSGLAGMRRCLLSWCTLPLEEHRLQIVASGKQSAEVLRGRCRQVPAGLTLDLQLVSFDVCSDIEVVWKHDSRRNVANLILRPGNLPERRRLEPQIRRQAFREGVEVNEKDNFPGSRPPSTTARGRRRPSKKPKGGRLRYTIIKIGQVVATISNC